MEHNKDQHIDAKIKQSFDAIQKNAPLFVWEAVEQQLDMDLGLDEKLDDCVQKVYKEQQPVVPKDLWGGIAKELEGDIDATIDQKLRDGLAKKEMAIAPTTLWDSIANSLNNEDLTTDAVLDEKLKESFLEGEKIKTPNKVWYAINRQLNIDKTWKNISKVLDKNPVVSDWRKRTLSFMALTALLLLLLKTCNYEPPTLRPVELVINQKEAGTLPTVEGKDLAKKALLEKQLKGDFVIPKSVERQKAEQEKRTSKQEEQQAQKIQNLQQLSVAKKTQENVQDLQEIIKHKPNKETKVDKRKELVLLNKQEKNKQEKERPIASLKVVEKEEREEVEDVVAIPSITQKIRSSREWLKPLWLTSIETNNVFEPILLVDELPRTVKSPKNVVEGKLEAGAFIVVNSTMLLNNETREGFDQNSLTTNYFGLAANYGLWAAYKISPKGALVAEFSINADNKQAYGTYDKGLFYIKEWVMKYNRVSLAYKHDLWQTKSKKLVNTKIVAQAGVYVGMMREAKLFYDGVLVYDKLADYHQFDFGFKVALGQELLIDKFVIGCGLRSDIGASNIFKGNVQLNAQENKTNIIHLGGYFLLGYRF